MQLDVDLAAQAIRTQIATPLQVSTEQAASAIVQVANANMADAVRLISLQRGYDPREFALVVFGGAGALHGAALAQELSIPTVIVPPHPGAWSALGCLMVDIRHDLSTMFLAPAHEVDVEQLQAAFAELEAEGHERLRTEGVGEDRIVLRRSIAMRYLGQWRSMNVELDPGPIEIETVVEGFHREHEREFSYRRDEAAVELYRLELTAIGQTDDVRLPRSDPSPDAALPGPASVREVWFDCAERPVDTPVYPRDALPVGARFVGPAVVDQLDTTTLIPPGVQAEIDEHFNIRMHILTES